MERILTFELESGGNCKESQGKNMTGNDWNHLGRDVKDIVQQAIDTGDFARLNRDLGVTLENALGNVADSVRRSASSYTHGQQNWNGNRGADWDRRWTEYSERYEQRRNENRRMRDAREQFAIYANTGAGKAVGITFMAVGFSLMFILGMVLGGIGIGALFSAKLAMKMPALVLSLGPLILISGVLGGYGNRMRKQIKRFRTYIRTLNGKAYTQIADLAKNVGKSEKYVKKDLKKMIEKRMFLEGHLDKNEVCLIVTEDAYRQYLETEKNMQEQIAFKEEKKAEKNQGLSKEAKAVIEEGNAYIEQIRRSNDAIPGVEISNKMYQLENVIRRIFDRVEQHPELISDLRKFMDYYLPTTMKLLHAYEELDKQPVEGENIRTAKQEIENTLDTINEAFENLLDSFFKSTAWDVSTDISVLKTMLAQEGLTDNKDFQGK